MKQILIFIFCILLAGTLKAQTTVLVGVVKTNPILEASADRYNQQSELVDYGGAYREGSGTIATFDEVEYTKFLYKRRNNLILKLNRGLKPRKKKRTIRYIESANVYLGLSINNFKFVY